MANLIGMIFKRYQVPVAPGEVPAPAPVPPGFNLLSSTYYDATSLGTVTSIDELSTFTGYNELPTTGFLKYNIATSSGPQIVNVAYVKDGSSISQSMFTLNSSALQYTGTVSSILFYGNDDHDSMVMDADGKGILARVNTNNATGNWDKFQGTTAVVTNSPLSSVVVYPPDTSFLPLSSQGTTLVAFPATNSAVWINFATQKYKVNNFTAGAFNTSETTAISTNNPVNSVWTMSDGVNQFMIGRWGLTSARLFTVNLSTGSMSSTAITLASAPTQTNTTEEDAFGTQLFSIDGYTSFYGGTNFYYGGTVGWKSGVNPVSTTGKSVFAASTLSYATQTDRDIFGSIDTNGYVWFADWGHDDGGMFNVGNDSQLGTRPTNIKKVSGPQLSIVSSGVSNENSQTISWQVSSNNVYPDSTVLYYTISGSGITATDFSAAGAGNSLTGSFSFTGGTWTKQLTTVPDITTELLETAILTVWLESSYTTILGSSSVTISDTSTGSPPVLVDTIRPTLSVLSGSLVPIVTSVNGDTIGPTLSVLSGSLVPIVTSANGDTIGPTLSVLSGSLVPIVTSVNGDTIGPTLSVLSGSLVPIVTSANGDTIGPTLGILSGTLE